MNQFEHLDGIVEIIVQVKYKNNYAWFCSDKIYWVMDYAKYTHGFDPDDHDYSERFNIGVLDSASAAAFLEKMKPFEVSSDSLRTLFTENLPFDSIDAAYHLFPKLLLDFDARKLYSMYPELLRLENYVLPSWEGFFSDFYALIPESEQYWIVDGCDYSMV